MAESIPKSIGAIDPARKPAVRAIAPSAPNPDEAEPGQRLRPPHRAQPLVGRVERALVWETLSSGRSHGRLFDLQHRVRSLRPISISR
jgi:hypothetical protein